MINKNKATINALTSDCLIAIFPEDLPEINKAMNNSKNFFVDV